MMMQLLAAADPMEHVLPHPIFGSHLTWFTNQSLMALVAAGLMIWIFPKLFSKPDSSPPTGAKNFFEAILEFLRLEVFRPALKENTDKFVPFLWTVFFFVLFCNVLGCLPLAELIGVVTLGHVQHIGGAATGSIATTATLAICAFLFIHFHGIDTIARQLMDGTYGKHEDHHHDAHGHDEGRKMGLLRAEGMITNAPGDVNALGNPTDHYHDGESKVGKHELVAMEQHQAVAGNMTPGKALLLAVPLYLWNFAPHPFRPEEGESKLKWILDLAIFVPLLGLELIGAIVKPFALCIRLFANMVAGHAVLAVLISLIVGTPSVISMFAVGIPAGLMNLAIQCLELFVAVLQAYIFTFLTTLFLSSAVAPEH